MLDVELDRVAERDGSRLRADPPPEPERVSEPEPAAGFVRYSSVVLTADDRFLPAVPTMRQGEDPLGPLANLAATLRPDTESVALAFDL